jgi:hypothetical protein
MKNTRYTNPLIVSVVEGLYPIELEWEPRQRFGFPLQPDHSMGYLKKLMVLSQSSRQFEGNEDEDCMAMPPYSENGKKILCIQTLLA